MSKKGIIEVGNSTLKFYDGARKRLHKVEWKSVDLGASVLQAIKSYDEWMLFGTHAKTLDKVLAVFTAHGKAPVKPQKRQELLDTEYKIDELGIDRYLGILGALDVVSSKGDSKDINTCVNTCVVGAGTAWTLDFVNHGQRHIGGGIALSPAKTLQALSEKTGGLPDLSLELRDWDWANTPQSWTSTKGAIAGALKAQFKGVFSEMLSSVQPKENKLHSTESTLILIHGGGAPLAQKALEQLGYKSVIVPELAFIAAEKLWHNKKVESF